MWMVGCLLAGLVCLELLVPLFFFSFRLVGCGGVPVPQRPRSLSEASSTWLRCRRSFLSFAVDESAVGSLVTRGTLSVNSATSRRFVCFYFLFELLAAFVRPCACA